MAHAASKGPEKIILMVLSLYPQIGNNTLVIGPPSLLCNRPWGTGFFEGDLGVWIQVQILPFTHYTYELPHFPVTSSGKLKKYWLLLLSE